MTLLEKQIEKSLDYTKQNLLLTKCSVLNVNTRNLCTYDLKAEAVECLSKE
jgi:hypothetical protein